MNEGFDQNKVVLGMSGGVDSTAAALLLAEKGFSVTGVYLDVLDGNEKGKEAAHRVADQMGIAFLWKDVSREFEEIVITDFCNEYMNGRTPNPCVLCNPQVKFKTLLQVADDIGAAFIATGHYAKVCEDSETGCFFIEKAQNVQKDQSYMLHRLSQQALSRLILPLGEVLDKADVRGLAREKNMPNADLKDSQEICFIPKDVHYINYLMTRGCAISKGDFVNRKGEVLGEHQGLAHYTIGQRKGLGITFGKPVFVTKLDDKTNQVMLGDHEELFGSEVISQNNWFAKTNGQGFPSEYGGLHVKAKIRYAAKPEDATLYDAGSGNVRTVFAKNQRAITPGQSIVFYQENRVLGGGIICDHMDL